MRTTSTNELSPAAAASDAILEQCDGFLEALGDDVYTRPSPAMFGATIGQHVRHSLDHFAAAIGAAEAGGEIDYDHRDRDTPVERDRAEAKRVIGRLRGRLASLAAGVGDRPVRVRVMLTADGGETSLASTLDRELAFATHHAIHHHAMIASIAAAARVAVPAGFGKAPSTQAFERSRIR